MEPGSVLGVRAGQWAGGAGGCDKPLLLQNVASRAPHIGRTQGASQTDRLKGSQNSSQKQQRSLRNTGLLCGNHRSNTPPGPGVDVLQAGDPTARLAGQSGSLQLQLHPTCSEVPDQNQCVLSLATGEGLQQEGPSTVSGATSACGTASRLI